jgi:predicted ferric reductase
MWEEGERKEKGEGRAVGGWLFWILAALFLLALIVGVPAYFVWRVAHR